MKIRDFENLCKKLKAITAAKDYCRCAHDGHAVNRLADREGLQIACVMPQKGFSGGTDSYKTHDTFIIYALEKDDSGQTPESELEPYERTEDAIFKIFHYLTEGERPGACLPFPNINVKGITIDPEYREFGGWNGYSITVSV
ncbi:hypothetical protein [Sphingobacterium sp. UGAL515B_05]|uniref:hypothetical protein n=1 Tax=Sphingobacterium sp. UGAL515B_05 TaxID=2986767 RepID=UPI002953EA40|nr:hypothetical protein [Sphingobacterium sp. UGAL515B_05]WON93899.1 hypothetical protein OK025_21940 [Sphingobacterium sp. UGAL515B_05]